MNFSTASVTLSSNRPPHSFASLEFICTAATENVRRGISGAGLGFLKIGAEKGFGSDEKNGMAFAVETNSDSIMLMLGQMGWLFLAPTGRANKKGPGNH